jgi:hypothetical protein
MAPKLQNDHTLTERSSLEVGAIMELLEVCLNICSGFVLLGQLRSCFIRLDQVILS